MKDKPVQTIELKMNLYYDNGVDYPKALFLSDKIEKHLKLQMKDSSNLFDKLMLLTLDQLQELFDDSET